MVESMTWSMVPDMMAEVVSCCLALVSAVRFVSIELR